MACTPPSPAAEPGVHAGRGLLLLLERGHALQDPRADVGEVGQRAVLDGALLQLECDARVEGREKLAHASCLRLIGVAGAALDKGAQHVLLGGQRGGHVAQDAFQHVEHLLGGNVLPFAAGEEEVRVLA